MLYSGGQERRNSLIHESLLALSPELGGARMTYVPVWSDYAPVYFARFRRRYERFGGRAFACLPIDRPGWRCDAAAERLLLESDIIYLAGRYCQMLWIGRPTSS